MYTKDVYTHNVETEICCLLRQIMMNGQRIGVIEGLDEKDIIILQNGYIEEYAKEIKEYVDVALHKNIPAFNRLCWCCEGILDCGSDHK